MSRSAVFGALRLFEGRYSEDEATEVVTTSTNAEHASHPAHDDLVPLAELIQQTPGAHPITSIDELRNDAFGSDEELDDFLAFVTKSRHTELA